MTTKLIEVRGPTAEEAAALGGDVVFVRRAKDGTEIKIHASVCHEGWQQWGAGRDLLSENQEAVETWRRGLDGVLGMIDESEFPDDDAEPELDTGDWSVGERAGAWDFGDRGEIVGFFERGGEVFANLQLDYAKPGDLQEVPVDNLSTLDDE